MSSSMKKATKMSVADFEAVQSIPDWAVFSFDSYMKYVGHGTLSHSEFLEYHTDWLKLVVKLDTKIFGNRQSRSKSKSHAKNPFIEDEAVNYGAGDCEEAALTASHSSTCCPGIGAGGGEGSRTAGGLVRRLARL